MNVKLKMDTEELRAELEDALHEARHAAGVDSHVPWREAANRALLRVQYWNSTEHGDLPAEVRRTAGELRELIRFRDRRSGGALGLGLGGEGAGVCLCDRTDEPGGDDCVSSGWWAGFRAIEARVRAADLASALDEVGPQLDVNYRLQFNELVRAGGKPHLSLWEGFTLAHFVVWSALHDSGVGRPLTVLLAKDYIRVLNERGCDATVRDARARRAADYDRRRRFPSLHPREGDACAVS